MLEAPYENEQVKGLAVDLQSSISPIVKKQSDEMEDYLNYLTSKSLSATPFRIGTSYNSAVGAETIKQKHRNFWFNWIKNNYHSLTHELLLFFGRKGKQLYPIQNTFMYGGANTTDYTYQGNEPDTTPNPSNDSFIITTKYSPLWLSRRIYYRGINGTQSHNMIGLRGHYYSGSYSSSTQGESANTKLLGARTFTLHQNNGISFTVALFGTEFIRENGDNAICELKKKDDTQFVQLAVENTNNSGVGTFVFKGIDTAGNTRRVVFSSSGISITPNLSGTSTSNMILTLSLDTSVSNQTTITLFRRSNNQNQSETVVIPHEIKIPEHQNQFNIFKGLFSKPYGGVIALAQLGPNLTESQMEGMHGEIKNVLSDFGVPSNIYA